MTLAVDSSVKGILNEDTMLKLISFMYYVNRSSIYEYEYADVLPDANQVLVVFDVTRAATLTQYAE
jgi:hypothetical protein